MAALTFQANINTMEAQNKAETDIINEIGRLRSMGNADYHAVAALERVQAILRRMENDSWEYAPKMIEKQFYISHPEARRIKGETAGKIICTLAEIRGRWMAAELQRQT